MAQSWPILSGADPYRLPVVCLCPHLNSYSLHNQNPSTPFSTPQMNSLIITNHKNTTIIFFPHTRALGPRLLFHETTGSLWYPPNKNDPTWPRRERLIQFWVFLDIKCGIFRCGNGGFELIVSPCIPFFQISGRNWRFSHQTCPTRSPDKLFVRFTRECLRQLSVFLDIKCGDFRSGNQGFELIFSPWMPFLQISGEI